MKRLVKVASSATAALVLLTAAAIAFLPGFSHETACENAVISKVASTSSPFQAVVFERSCGATTDFSTQASLLRIGAELPNEAGNIFIADTNHGAAPSGLGGGPEVRVTWGEDFSVTVSHHPRARVFKAETEFGGIKVRVVPSTGAQQGAQADELAFGKPTT